MLNFFSPKSAFFQKPEICEGNQRIFSSAHEYSFYSHRIFKINKHVLKLPLYYVTHFVKNTFEAEEQACNGS
jgi:hypothetical protein